jgi:SAM-dependent methyltransferase
VDRDRLLQLYDQRYAATYDERFLTSEIARVEAEYEITLLAGWLKPGQRWLDVACGTGFFLSRFPTVEREGLDLSPDMLALARQANPGVTFHQRDFLDDCPEWRDRWDLVSCMWYAYGLVSTVRDIERLVANLALWTSPTGRCFVPLADPRLISGVELPYRLRSPWPGQASITGILWSYSEDGGTKVHAHQVAPHVEYMEELFGRYFSTVELEVYPPAAPNWEGRRRALVASQKSR